MALHIAVLVAVSLDLSRTAADVLPDSHVELVLSVLESSVLQKNVVLSAEKPELLSLSVDTGEEDAIPQVRVSILSDTQMRWSRAPAREEALAPCNVEAIAEFPRSTASRVGPSRGGALVVDPEPIVTAVAIDIFEADALDITHALSRESQAEWLPILGCVLDPSITPAVDVAAVINDTIVAPAVAVDISKPHSGLRIALVLLNQGRNTGSLEGWWFRVGSVALVDRQIGVAFRVNTDNVVITVRCGRSVRSYLVR